MQKKLLAITPRLADKGRAISNTPALLTPLIDREREVEAACVLIRRSGLRLLTLIGPGGVGKTRLALQIATELLGDFAEGVYFVSLDSISDPALVLPAIARALGLRTRKGRSPAGQLQACLREKHLLLLLDNFEQVVPAAPLLLALLADCRELKLLVTARAPLHVRGEHEFPVPPLALPDLKRPPDAAALSHYAATELFLQRALAIQPDFLVTDATAPIIAEICTRLDGLPLALELAAARTKLLSPHALLARLERRLPLLTGGAQDLPARQQTLRNTIKWSYDLLDTHEQQLFRLLSIFAGGCTLEAAEAVCVASGHAALQVLDGMAGLLDKSQLRLVEQQGDEQSARRLMMPEMMREFGLELLAAHDEMEAVQYAHARYYLWLAEEVEPRLAGAGQWLQRLESEHENLRAALGWLLERAESGMGMEQAEMAKMALRLGGALWRFWAARGHWSEGQRWLERALAVSHGVAGTMRAKALNTAGVLAYLLDNYERAEALCREGLALYREIGDGSPQDTTFKRTGPLSALTTPLYPAGLSTREVEVLRLIAEGMTNTQIAAQLVISPLTVNTHVRSIYSKLEVTSRSAATRFAIERKLV